MCTKLWAWTSSPYYQIAVSLFLLIVPKAGGTTEGRVEVCESKEVNLIFPNTPASSAGDIKAKAWNKVNGIRVASWTLSTDFVVSPSYEDRLTDIGENSIKIRNVTRSDAGTYTLVLTIGSKPDFREFLVHLEVLVSPSDQCTLTISREGDSLMAELPLEGCGSPRLSPRWINRTQKLIGNINVLKLDPGMGQEIYIVCAVGESRRCFQGDAKHLCANYTELGPKIESEPESVTAILMPVLIITSVSVIAVSVILAYYWRRKRKMEHGESVLIIIDGLDEVIDNLEPIANLLKLKEEVFPCTIVLTSRPAGLECFLEKEARELRLFQIHGMGLDISQEYVGKVLGIRSRIHHNELAVNQYWNCMRDLQVQSLCQVPFLCLSLIFYWLDGTAVSGDMTDILLYIVECHIRHAMTRRCFLDNIGKVLEDNYFEISKPIKIITNKQCLREYGHLLKVISDVAKEIWALQLQKETCVKGIEIVNLTKDIVKDCVELCVETGILIKTVFPKMARERTQIAFSHVLLFNFFVAFSLAIGKRDSFSGCLPRKEAVPDNSYINLMLRELTTNNGHTVSSTGDHSTKDNPKNTSKKSGVSNQRSYCNVQ